ncbi:unnamed protein product [Trichobilharzia regenti]|nr:unnamed protein product [Trichobilharzia regenti]
MYTSSSLSYSEEDDNSSVCDTKKNDSDDHQIKEVYYPDFEHITFTTILPRSVDYTEAADESVSYVPIVLMELLKSVDRFIPPLSRAFYGINADNYQESDRILSILIDFCNHTTSRDHDEWQRNLIQQCSPTTLMQLIQLYFLRLKSPLFIATPQFCDIIQEKDFFFNYKSPSCSDMNNQVTRAVKECLKGLSIYQQATLSYFIERCQRWCHSEVAYQIKAKVNRSADIIYGETIKLLSQLFANCIIGLTKEYISSRLLKCDTNNTTTHLDQLKREIFVLLTGMVSTNVWHINSIKAINAKREEIRPQETKRNSLMYSTSDLSESTYQHKILVYLDFVSVTSFHVFQDVRVNCHDIWDQYYEARAPDTNVYMIKMQETKINSALILQYYLLRHFTIHFTNIQLNLHLNAQNLDLLISRSA